MFNRYNNSVVEPDVFLMQVTGVVDVNGNNIHEHDIMAHGMSNVSRGSQEGYNVLHGSAFINEYPWINLTNRECTDGGTKNPNYLLGAFPWLFPYGQGSLEVA